VPGDIAEIWVKSSVDGLYHHAADYDYYSKSFTFTDPAFVTSVRGKKVNFVNDSSFRCVGFRVSMAHAHYATCFEIRAAVSLNFVEGLTEAKTEDREYLNVTNYAYGSMTRSNGDHIAHDIAYGTARTLIDLPEILIAKSYEGFFNDVTHFIYKADWKVAATENHTDTASSGGVIFDLLPVRTTLVKDVNVADGCGIEAKAGTKKLVCGSDYTVEEYYNYNNTGRTLIVVRFNEIASRYEISYSTEITWDNIKDYGPVLHNVAAYKSGNTIVKNGVNGTSGPIDLSAVDENASSELFTYTTNDHTIRIPLSGQLGLYKQVSGLSTQSSSTTVYNGGYYEYDIRFSTDPASRAKDLILYDSLENYVIKRQPYGEDIPSDWHGKLTSVDVSRLIHLGIDPVIYYSTVPDLDVETHTDLSDGSVWSTAVDDIGEVTAIAIDARRKTDGTEYVLPPDSAVSVILRMQAPDYIESDSTDPKTYNNIYLYNTLMPSEGDSAVTKLIHQEHATVAYRLIAGMDVFKANANNPEIAVPNAEFRLSGRSYYGTYIDSVLTTGVSGKISFRNVERGDYTLEEISTSREFLLDDTQHTVSVDKYGNVTLDGESPNGDGVFVITNTPRVFGEFSFTKRGLINRNPSAVTTLSGVTFKLTGESDYGTYYTRFATSDGSGVVDFGELELGSYTVVEMNTPAGYLPFESSWEVVCNDLGVLMMNGENVVEYEEDKFTVMNVPERDFTLFKRDTLSGASLNGATFRLTGTTSSGRPIDMTVTTSGSG
ncbi:MAG: hypothetical protein IKG80_07715, partial [Clostridia bacterium]|nr:hypothetical protein [Clostridia bacterium]